MRPNRQTRRRKGKSDPTDAKAAARAVLSAEAAGSPKACDDLVEMIRVLRVARGTAVLRRSTLCARPAADFCPACVSINEEA
jgi:transposase